MVDGLDDLRPLDAGLVVRLLPFRPPLDAAHLLGFLGAHAVAGVEVFDGHTYSRTLDLPHGPAAISVSIPGAREPSAVEVRLRLTDRGDLSVAVSQVRRLLDLDADPLVIDEVLAAVPGLGDLVARRPGLRCPGAADGFELAARTVVGQQVSLAGARTVLARIVAEHGRDVFGGRRMFPPRRHRRRSRSGDPAAAAGPRPAPGRPCRGGRRRHARA